MNSIGKRILGILMFCIGVGVAFWLKSVYDSNTNFPDKVVVLAPVLIIYGAFMAVLPDMVMDRGEWANAPGGKKAINIVITLVAVGIGLWVRFGVFSAWK